METQDPVAAYLATRKKAPATDDPVAAYLATRKPDPRTTRHDGVPFVDAKPEEPSYLQQAAGGVASLLRSVPGGEAAQAGVRALVRRQPYAQAREDIRDAEDTASPFVRNLNSVAGGVLSAAVMPGSPALQGARYGIASGLGDSDPDANVTSRLHSAAGQGLLGAAGGAVAGGVGKVVNTIRGAPPGGLKKIAEAALPDMVRRPLRIARAYQSATKPALPAGQVSPLVPKAEGLQSAFEGVDDAVRTQSGPSGPFRSLGPRATTTARPQFGEPVPSTQAEGLQSAIETAGERQGPSGVVGAIQAQRAAQRESVVEAVKKAKPRHRTQSSFDDFAQRMGKAPQQPAHRTSPPLATEPPQGLAANEAGAAQDILTQLRRQQPLEVGNKWSDADIALGKDMPEPDLIDLLRRSLAARGGVPAPNR